MIADDSFAYNNIYIYRNFLQDNIEKNGDKNRRRQGQAKICSRLLPRSVSNFNINYIPLQIDKDFI